MILRLSIFALVLCLAASSPAQAQWWPWGKKKDHPTTEQSDPPKVFNDTQEEGMPEKKWALDGVFNQKRAEDDMVINGIKFKGLKPGMMSASYTPQNLEEMAIITFAKKSWEADAMDAMEKAAQARIAAAEKKAAAALEKMKKEGSAHLAQAEKLDDQPVAAQPIDAKTPKVQIFNRSDDGKPSKVFQNYR